MTTLDGARTDAFRLDGGRVMRLDPKAVTKAPDDMIKRMREAWEAQYRIPVGPPDNAPENLYAEIQVNGKTVARLYNSGIAELPNKLASLRLSQAGTGPALAQTRAEQIAKAIGGTIQPASTAQTQAEWEARPPRQFRIDTEAMERDRALFFQSREPAPSTRAAAAPSTAVRAQLLAQEGDAVSPG